MMSWILRAHLAMATVWLVAALWRSSSKPIDVAGAARCLVAAGAATLAWQLTAGAGHGATSAGIAAVAVHIGAVGLVVGPDGVVRRGGAVVAALGLIGLAARLVVPF